jgi:hypothetical protein
MIKNAIESNDSEILRIHSALQETVEGLFADGARLEDIASMMVMEVVKMAAELEGLERGREIIVGLVNTYFALVQADSPQLGIRTQ